MGSDLARSRERACLARGPFHTFPPFYGALSLATLPGCTCLACASTDSFRSISISRTDSTRGTRRMNMKSYRPL